MAVKKTVQVQSTKKVISSEVVEIAPEVVETPKTAGGKEIDIVADKTTALWKIQFKSGGELPSLLQGLFTTHRSAQIAVAEYLNQGK